MSNIDELSSKLGVYMLKGWVLTDTTCPTPGCNVPLMRSSAGRTPVVHFCVNCTDDPDAPAAPSAPEVPAARSSRSPSNSEVSTHYSRPSTPPTEVSSSLSSPTFAPPAETAESLRRRRQSDQASQEIGKRLLKGWAMLADECPNPRCYGIPLVRPPKTGPSKDPRKECVACGTVYVDEKNANGRDGLVAQSSTAAAASDFPTSPTISNSKAKGKGVLRDDSAQDASSMLDMNSTYSAVRANGTVPNHASTITGPPLRIVTQPSLGTSTKSSSLLALEASASSLETTLHALSGRLTALSLASTVSDPGSITQTAEAISRVTHALGEVTTLRRNLSTQEAI